MKYNVVRLLVFLMGVGTVTSVVRAGMVNPALVQQRLAASQQQAATSNTGQKTSASSGSSAGFSAGAASSVAGFGNESYTRRNANADLEATGAYGPQEQPSVADTSALANKGASVVHLAQSRTAGAPASTAAVKASSFAVAPVAATAPASKLGGVAGNADSASKASVREAKVPESKVGKKAGKANKSPKATSKSKIKEPAARIIGEAQRRTLLNKSRAAALADFQKGQWRTKKGAKLNKKAARNNLKRGGNYVQQMKPKKMLPPPPRVLEVVPDMNFGKRRYPVKPKAPAAVPATSKYAMMKQSEHKGMD